MVKLNYLLMLFFLSFCSFCFAKDAKLTVILDWLINPDHAPLFLAQEKGFFKEEGLDVKLMRPPDLNNPLRLLVSNKADIAVDYQPQLVLAMGEGFDLKQVGILIKSPLNCLVVLKKSGIHKLEDLKGKKIGYAMSGVDTAMIEGMLKQVGLNTGDVQLVYIPHGLTQSLITHRVDAITGVMRQFEVNKLNLAGHLAKAFYPEDYGIPSYSELVFASAAANVRNDKIKRFLRAVQKGVVYLNKHPKQSWKLFAEKYPVLDTEMTRLAWFETIPLFSKKPSVVDWEQCRKLVNYLKSNLPKEFMKKSVDAVCSG